MLTEQKEIPLGRNLKKVSKYVKIKPTNISEIEGLLVTSKSGAIIIQGNFLKL